MMSPEMEQWRYMEMQRQLMSHQQQQQQHMSSPHHHQSPHPQQHSKGLKRPLPNKPTPLTNNNSTVNNHHSSMTTNDKEDDQTEQPPPSKHPKLASKADSDKGLQQETMDEDNSVNETPAIETSN